jgi:SAM-dependent methyltransferase
MKIDLLELLRCPRCRGKLALAIEKKTLEDVEAGTLSCTNCSSKYPIVRSIPRFVSTDEYVSSFSAQWNWFSRTQLDANRKLETTSKDAFRDKTGFENSDLEGRVILEAGCGMGRFLDVVSRARSATVVGFDLSLAVESAYQNVGKRCNVNIVQADIMQPPFASDTFDLIYSIGVLHHTPNPFRAFSALVPLLSHGGRIAIWVYPKYDWTLFSDIYRHATSRMPRSMLLRLGRMMVLAHSIDNILPPLLRKWLNLAVPISGETNPEARLLDIFDWYSPKYQFKLPTQEVLDWFHKLRLQNVEALNIPVSVKAQRN